MPSLYPISEIQRDRWILEHRRDRAHLNPLRPYAYSMEEECANNGEIVPVANVFLTNRECPWKCLMCDLWQNTLTNEVPAGAIPAQIDYALSRLPVARVIKLYNSGSFFDCRAIPVGDHPVIAAQVGSFERVIVECHPALVRDDCLRFRDMLEGRLEVAMGLETVHPEILPRLNKRMTLDQFSRAAEWLRANNIDLRVFILVKPPFMRDDETSHWTGHSLDFAFDCGATVASLIPTRAGNGAMDELQQSGDFSPPSLETLEASLAYGINRKRGRVFLDLWGLNRIAACPACRDERFARLKTMNLSQSVPSPVRCTECGGGN